MTNIQKVELMAPAGSFESMMAAIKAGADSVYFGVEQLNMRARAANNFVLDDLQKIVSICNEHGVKTYLTVNTLMYDHDIPLMKKICDRAKKAGITAVIASDISVIEYAYSIRQTVHISTQLNVSNIEAIKFFSRYADMVVLARELTLQQVKKICDDIREQNIRGASGNLMKIEVFAHGALCVAISGKCYMSLATYNSSANRGACLQNCRRAYKVIDEETGDELQIDNKYIMSPKDLCTIGFLDKILETGVSVLKFEGRGKPPEYVYTVIKAYREAVDSYYEGTYGPEKVKRWIEKLKTVYNRGFWHGGYFLGKQLGEWSGVHGSKATKEKLFIGQVKNYFSNVGIGEFQLQSGIIKPGDEILISGPTTGVVQTKIKSIRLDDFDVDHAKKGDSVTIPVPEKIRFNDKLFLIKDKV